MKLKYSAQWLKKKCGFTLAEVLITLGIIGVVAAITIPSLITQNRARVLRSQYLKSYSMIYQMVRLMENDDVSLDTSVLGKIPNYLKGTTYCGGASATLYGSKDNTLCFRQSNGAYKSYDGNTIIEPSAMDDAQYVLPDGTLFLFEWDTLHYNDGSHCWIHVDINGVKNGPNRFGVDVFTFQFTDGKLLAMGDEGTLFSDLDKYCNLKVSNNYNGLACAHYAKADADWFKKAVKLK